MPNQDDTTVIVKLIQSSYGFDIHRSLAEAQLAPQLIGESRMEGAPVAVVMEYLDPREWITIFDLFAKHTGPALLAAHSIVKPAIESMLKHLELNRMVHGDLRPNNILVKVSPYGPPVRTDQDQAIIKVVDFDWGGPEGQVFYSIARNPRISWPGVDGGCIVQGHDNQLVSEWLYS